MTSYRHIDPFEDTESAKHRVALASGATRYRHIDPFEDTESMVQSLLPLSGLRVTGISIRLRILKDASFTHNSMKRFSYRHIDPFEDTER